MKYFQCLQKLFLVIFILSTKPNNSEFYMKMKKTKKRILLPP